MFKIMRSASGEYVRRVVDDARIPFNEENTDYQAYLAWVEEGNEPEVVEL